MIIPENENCHGLVVETIGHDMLAIGYDGLVVDSDQAQQLIIVLQRWIEGEDIEDDPCS
ncbi:hypothetical protein [Pectobacterium versatile]|uniref:hypothetical protein n=1 Tax=Pectobacterium versatile TaxID=2488639 RepID=UPI00138739E0|nr:hypothetical protein [Pectobacterium versatile]UEQ10493.1 hypothetical protein LLE50_05110 [Pectobacterium versatile]GKX40322.1 hypothetical protein SOASR014_40610 [Pectobacterium carotovorum subsp. carotovorum]GLX46405.1 hypothetical protein Pcaca01_40730 [Pectobacterium carotovorum subsp. carotovorum]